MDGSPMSIRQLWSIKRGKSSVVTCIARAGCALYRSWFLGGKRTNLPYWDHQKRSVKLIGGVIDDREFFITEVAGRFTSGATIRLFRTLQDEFGEKTTVLLDNASYFNSRNEREFVEDTAIKMPYSPRGSSDLSIPSKSAGASQSGHSVTAFSDLSTNSAHL
jgi:hypothetical protein